MNTDKNLDNHNHGAGDLAALPPEALQRFEDHLPLLERVVSQVLGASGGSVRDAVYLGASVLLRCALEWHPGLSLGFKEFAEVTVTSEILHHMHYPVPVLQLPAQLAPYTPRINAIAQGIASLQPAAPALALTSYQAMSLRHPAFAPAGMGGYPTVGQDFYGGAINAQVMAKPPANPVGTVWTLFKKRMPLILGLVLLTEMGITAFTIKSPKTYLAATTLNSGIAQKDPINGGGDWFTQGTVIANITELIKSRTVLDNTITALGLHTTPEKLAKHITVNRIGQTGLLKVEADAVSARGSSELANTTVREFLRYYATTQSHDARSNKAFFASQVAAAKQKLRTAEGHLKTFKGDKVPEMAAGVPARVSELIGQRDEAARALAAAQAGLSTVQHELGRIKADPLLSQRILNNDKVVSSSDKVRELQNNLDDAKQIYGANSPVTTALAGKIARAHSQLRTTAVEASESNPALAEATAKQVQMRMDIAMNAARLRSLNASLANLTPQAHSASTDQVTYEQLQREVTIAAAQYQDLETKFGQSNLAAQGAANLNISVVDAALPPKEPQSAKLLLKLILGLILSLGLGLFVSYLMSLRDKETGEETEAQKAPRSPKLLQPGLTA